MRALTLFLLFLSIPALAFPENATLDNATPPSMPQSEGLLALQALFVNSTPAIGMPLVISATTASGTTTYRLITGREGNVLLTLDRGSYQLACVLDNMETSGADFAATASLSLPGEQNRSLVFYPAGSVAITALEGGNVVPLANMHVSCASDWFDYEKVNGADAKAGQAGDFLYRALPTGTCIISASTQTSAGSVQVEVEQGKLLPVQLELKPKAFGILDIALVVGAILVAAYLAYHLFFAGRKHAAPAPIAQHMHEEETAKKNTRAPAKRAEAKIAARASAGHAEAKAAAPAQHKASAFDVEGERARAVLSTLTEREAEITRFLCASGGKAKRSTMQHKLLIPKTSLLRNLRALERKRIVKLIPFGRNLVAELERSLFE